MRQKIKIPTATAATTARIEPTITPTGGPINTEPELPAEGLGGRVESAPLDSLEVVMTTKKQSNQCVTETKQDFPVSIIALKRFMKHEVEASRC